MCRSFNVYLLFIGYFIFLHVGLGLLHVSVSRVSLYHNRLLRQKAAIYNNIQAYIYTVYVCLYIVVNGCLWRNSLLSYIYIYIYSNMNIKDTEEIGR